MYPVFTSLNFAKIFFLQSKVFSLVFPTPNLEDQVSVFMYHSDRVTQLYPLALGSLLIALYGSQDYGGGIITRLHTEILIGTLGGNFMRIILKCILRNQDMRVRSWIRLTQDRE
jgi:hypothetical protein